jgi:hypothetical protein
MSILLSSLFAASLLRPAPTLVRASAVLCDVPPPPPTGAPTAAPANAPATTPPPATDAKYSENWSGAGRFSDSDPLPLSFWLLGPNKRRGIIMSLGIWGVIAPATNLWGTGSFFLSLFPQAARDAKLDTFYPVAETPLYPYSNGYLDYSSAKAFRRFVDDANRFEFRYPATYVQDQAVFLRNADAAYARRTMDPTLAATPSRVAPSRRSQQGVSVAFGPGEGSGTRDENLSVVVGSLMPGFTLRGTLGTPEEGADRLLKETIQKQSVVRKATLLGAVERISARSGKPLYQFEYRVDYEDDRQKPSYTVCVVGSTRDSLFTFASRVPAAVWAERADDLREAASSFVLY